MKKKVILASTYQHARNFAEMDLGLRRNEYLPVTPGTEQRMRGLHGVEFAVLNPFDLPQRLLDELRINILTNDWTELPR